MPTLTYLGDEYSCATAIKGADYIHLLNEAGVMIAAFDEITDFSGFKLTNGSYTSPVADHDCYLAVLRDDGTIGRGGHKCSDIPQTAADVGAVSKSGDTMTGVLKQVLGDNTTSLTATGDGTYLLNEKGGKSAGLILNPTNGTVTFRHHDGTSPSLYNIYHSGNKPTAADVGAVSKSGDTMTGSLHIDGGANGLSVYVDRVYNGVKYTANAGVFPEGNPYFGRRKNGALESYLLFNDKELRFNSEVGGIYAEVLHTRNLSANGVPRIETGSYVGTGELSKTLTLSGEPQMLIVSDTNPFMYGETVHAYDQFIWHKGVTKHIVAQNTYGQGNRNFVVEGNTIRWSAEVEIVSSSAMNNSGTTYFYTAIVK